MIPNTNRFAKKFFLASKKESGMAAMAKIIVEIKDTERVSQILCWTSLSWVVSNNSLGLVSKNIPMIGATINNKAKLPRKSKIRFNMLGLFFKSYGALVLRFDFKTKGLSSAGILL